MHVPLNEQVELVGRTEHAFIVRGSSSDETCEIPCQVKLTKARIDALPYQSKGQRLHCDTDLPGFYLVVGKQTKTYVAQGTLHDRAKRITIGRHHLYTPTEARDRARRLLQQMRDGIDPSEQRRKAKQEVSQRHVTLQQAFDAYKQARTLKPTTLSGYEQMMGRYLKKWLNRPLGEITSRQVKEAHSRIKANPGQPTADSAMRLLRAIFEFAEGAFEDESGAPLFPLNPVRILSKTKAWGKNRPRRTYITDAQLPTWFKAIDTLRLKGDDSREALGCDYLELVLLTGLRRNEAATMTWDRVDLDDRTLRLDDTKNGRPHVLPLTDYLIAILSRRKRVAEAIGSPYVFPSPSGRPVPLGEPRFISDKVKADSGVQFTIHDLRRTFCTKAASLGTEDYRVKRLMNHAQSSDITSQYQQLSVEDLREPMERITKAFLALRTRRIKRVRILDAS